MLKRRFGYRAVRKMDRKRINRDLRVLTRFVEVYCRRNHGSNGHGLCGDCRDLVDYGRVRLEKCSYDPKPKCKDCPTHCYRSDYREKAKEVMRFSGMYFVRRGRLDWLIRYFL